jgi:hypothetical protein
MMDYVDQDNVLKAACITAAATTNVSAEAIDEKARAIYALATAGPWIRGRKAQA